MPTTPRLRLTNPFVQTPTHERARIQATVSIPVHTYLFRRILTDQGGPQDIIATAVKKIYDECIRRKIGFTDDPARALWDEDTEHQVAQILQDLNFNTPNANTTEPRRKPTTRRPSPPTA